MWAIVGYFAVFARNCLASTLNYIVMQMRKANREKGYSLKISFLVSSLGNEILSRSIEVLLVAYSIFS